MGGLGGHILHPYEDMSLTCDMFKQMFAGVLSSSFCGCGSLFEKTDGQNLFVRWDRCCDEVFVARNKGDIVSGGIKINGLLKRFVDKPAVASAFFAGAHAIETIFRERSSNDKLFDDVWFSIEVMAKNNPNVIHYGNDLVVLHQFGPSVFRSGKLHFLPDDRINELFMKIFGSNDRVGLSDGWTVYRPQRPVVDQISVDINNTYRKLDVFFGGSGNVSIGERLVEQITSVAPNALRDNVLEHEMAKHAVGLPDAVGFYELAKKFGQSDKRLLRQRIDLIKSFSVSLREAIEEIVHEFSVQLLGCLKSSLVKDPKAEVQRIKSNVGTTLFDVDASSNDNAKLLTARCLKRMGNINAIDSAIEGVVFRYNGNGRIYKLTGNFAPINQILGITKYNRA